MKIKEKKKGLLAGGLFDRPFMDSKATTNSVSTKEWVLGHLVGPLGLIFVVNTIAALVEKFFTQQTGAMYGVGNVEMIMKMGGWYEIIMTTAKILGVGVGLLNGWLIQKTESRQGRMRPWHLIFGFVSIIIGCLIFLFPGNHMGNIYWFYFFFLVICYHTIGSSYFYLFRDTICSLVTRDPKEKAFIQYIRKMSWTLISGIIIGMMISMVVLPLWLEKDIKGYPILMICLSVAAIPLLLLEYYYTRERITEDVAAEYTRLDQQKVPLRDQLKALLSNKYFVILMLHFLHFTAIRIDVSSIYKTSHSIPRTADSVPEAPTAPFDRKGWFWMRRGNLPCGKMIHICWASIFCSVPSCDPPDRR